MYSFRTFIIQANLIAKMPA